jgi:hypothetical protein
MEAIFRLTSGSKLSLTCPALGFMWCVCVCACVCLSVCLSVCLCLCFFLSLAQVRSLSLFLSVCVSVCLCVCLSVSRFMWCRCGMCVSLCLSGPCALAYVNACVRAHKSCLCFEKWTARRCRQFFFLIFITPLSGDTRSIVA